MNTHSDIAERQARILGELSEFGLSLARDLHARALAADDAAACDLALAFHRVSRSVRQTLALELRLERERRQGAREIAQDAACETLARVQRRKSQVRAALTREIWNEAEDGEAENLLEDLDDRLYELTLDDDFTVLPLDACIARIRIDLGLPPVVAVDLTSPPPRKSSA